MRCRSELTTTRGLRILKFAHVGSNGCGRRAMPTYDLIVEVYMPNLENLKKQAKLILRWHRERHYPVAAQIREHLPRFLNMPDSEIIEASFKLSDAQEMVARQQ